MALSVEVAEIVEIFQWLTQEESKNLNFEKRERVKEEIGDVMIFLANLADKLGIDPMHAAKEKIKGLSQCSLGPQRCHISQCSGAEYVE